MTTSNQSPDSWAARNWRYVIATVALLGWAVAAIQAAKKGEPIPPPPSLGDLPLPLADAAVGPIDYEGMRYHGDHHGDDHGPEAIQAQPARWPVDRITYGIDYASARGLNPPLSDVAIQAAIRQAAGWWSEHLAIDLVEVPFGTGPHIPIRFERIDGPGGVLAEAYLANGTTAPKPLRFDSGERWTPGAPAANLVSLPTVGCHELGHSLGLGHDAQTAPAVMRPTYTASLPREQDRDISRMVALGYKRREKVPPAPVDVLTFPVQVKTNDVVEALKKAGYEVTKP